MLYSTMKLLSYNVCLLPPIEIFLSGEPLAKRRTRYTALRRHLKALLMDADVVVFCEMFRYTFPTDQSVEPIREDLEDLGYAVVDSGFRDGSAVNSGVVVAAKLPVVHSAYHRFEASIGDELLAAKGFYEVALRNSDNTIVLVYGTHMQAHLGVENAKVRAQQLRQIREAMENAQVRYAPQMTILMGDLNIDGPLTEGRGESGDGGVERVEGRVESGEGRGESEGDYTEYNNLMSTFPEFIDTALRSGGELATWDPTTNSVIRSKHQHKPPADPAELTKRERLDYVLVSPATVGVSAATRVVRPRFKAEDGVRDVSDHYGLLCVTPGTTPGIYDARHDDARHV